MHWTSHLIFIVINDQRLRETLLSLLHPARPPLIPTGGWRATKAAPRTADPAQYEKDTHTDTLKQESNR